MSEILLVEKCGLTIEFGDDFGDNHCTFHCQLEKDHEGPHMEVGDMGYGRMPIPYTLTWQGSQEELDKVSEDAAMQELANEAQELNMGY